MTLLSIRHVVPTIALALSLATNASAQTSAIASAHRSEPLGAPALSRAIESALSQESTAGGQESAGGNQAATPPQPAHTGLAALVVETGRDFNAFPRRTSTWVILGAGGALAAAVHPLDDDVNARLVSSSSADKIWKAGNVIGGAGMAIAPVAVYLVGRYVVADDPATRTNKWSHLGFDMVRAQIVNEALVQGMKFSVRRTRPNGGKNSFPSGHAAATFAMAAVLERHLGYRFAWPTVVLASYVATSRLHDNVHYLSDVVFGAALGTTVGWTVVGRHGRSSYALTPIVSPRGVAFAFVRVPESQRRP